MWLLILEALAALSLLLFAVWWTMFSGRRRRHDEAEDADDADDADASDDPQRRPRDKDRR
jgi:cbb3-type cytochrome oxidase subunit 3